MNNNDNKFDIFKHIKNLENERIEECVDRIINDITDTYIYSGRKRVDYSNQEKTDHIHIIMDRYFVRIKNHERMKGIIFDKFNSINRHGAIEYKVFSAILDTNNK